MPQITYIKSEVIMTSYFVIALEVVHIMDFTFHCLFSTPRTSTGISTSKESAEMTEMTGTGDFNTDRPHFLSLRKNTYSEYVAW